MHQLLLFTGGIQGSDTQSTPSTVVERDGDGNVYVNAVEAAGYLSGAGLYLGSQVITTSATIVQTATVIKCNAASAAQTNTLPPASASAGQYYLVIKIDSSGNVPTIQGNGSDNINGSNTYTGLTAQWDVVRLYCDGTQWLIV